MRAVARRIPGRRARAGPCARYIRVLMCTGRGIRIRGHIDGEAAILGPSIE